jgi:hypothetical protein
MSLGFAEPAFNVSIPSSVSEAAFMLEHIQMAVQTILGLGLLYGSLVTFRNWHLCRDSSRQNHG